jgi:hypothetical protein
MARAAGMSPSALENDDARRSPERIDERRRCNAMPHGFPLVEDGKPSGASSDHESIGQETVDHLMLT